MYVSHNYLSILDSKQKKGKKLAKKVKKKRTAKHNSDDEAIEESDDGDYDDKEVDYISDSGR
jgi:transcription initiation factor TFIIF subunit alpha